MIESHTCNIEHLKRMFIQDRDNPMKSKKKQTINFISRPVLMKSEIKKIIKKIKEPKTKTQIYQV